MRATGGTRVRTKCPTGCTCGRHSNGPAPCPTGCTCHKHKDNVPCVVMEAHTGQPCNRDARPRFRGRTPMCPPHLSRSYARPDEDPGYTPIGAGPLPCPEGCDCSKHDVALCPEGCECNKHIGRPIGGVRPTCETGCTCYRHRGRVYHEGWNKEGQPRNTPPIPNLTPRERGDLHRFSHEKAEAIINSHGWDAMEEYPGYNNVRWLVRHRACGEVVKVDLGHIQPPPNGLSYHGQPYVGCPSCGRERQLQGYKDAEAQKAIDYMETHGFTLKSPYPGYNKPIQVLHDKCGLVVPSSYRRIRCYHGCPQCAPASGLNAHKPADVYLIRRKGVLKVGIYNTERLPNQGNRRDRLQRHVYHGWTIARTWSFPTGSEARTLEQTVLKHWRNDLGAPAALEVGEMITGGETETVLTRKVGLQRTIDYIEELAA